MKSTAIKTLSLSAMIALAVGGFTAPSAQASPCDPLVHSAQQLNNLLTTLKEDLKGHYYHTPKFREIIQSASAMRQSSDHIVQIAYQRSVPIQHLEADVAAIDQQSHQLHNLVDRMEDKRNGHVHGNTKHTHELLAAVTATIHTMQQQIQVLKQPVYSPRGHFSHGGGYPAQPQRQPIYAAPPVSYGQAPVYTQAPTYGSNGYGGGNYGYHQPVAAAPAPACSVNPGHSLRNRRR